MYLALLGLFSADMAHAQAPVCKNDGSGLDSAVRSQEALRKADGQLSTA
jgi:hypothetical protein